MFPCTLLNSKLGLPQLLSKPNLFKKILKIFLHEGKKFSLAVNIQILLTKNERECDNLIQSIVNIYYSLIFGKSLNLYVDHPLTFNGNNIHIYLWFQENRLCQLK